MWEKLQNKGTETSEDDGLEPRVGKDFFISDQAELSRSQTFDDAAKAASCRINSTAFTLIPSHCAAINQQRDTKHTDTNVLTPSYG